MSQARAAQLTGINFRANVRRNSNGVVDEAGDTFMIRAVLSEDLIAHLKGEGDGSSANEEEDDDIDEAQCVSEADGLLPVSAKLRARLLNVCGCLAYLAGDPRGGYKCFRASASLDDDLLDSKLKLSSIMIEMDDLDKVCM